MVFIYCQIDFEGLSRTFTNPIDIIQTHSLSELPDCFERMDAQSAQGNFLAGFLSYEAGYGVVENTAQKERFEFPLLHFGVYSPESVETRRRFPVCLNANRFQLDRLRRRAGRYYCNRRFFKEDYGEYRDKIETIRDFISEGETYQITFCLQGKLDFLWDTKDYYQALLNFQPVPYPAYIDTGKCQVLSLSPELLFKNTGGKITVKPMKGTLFHAGGLRNELFGARWLHRDPKNRAENIMITDLLRNDLGKICEIGSVKTKKLCEVAKYRTVFQMTSTVEGELRKADSKLGVPTLYEIFKALFPSGSVTGAPKLRSMQIIRELETQERRIYTGAIGFVSPNQGSQKGEIYFNVPIRTLLVEGNRAEMGIGGGITHYSTPEGEWEECQIKARFIRG